MITPSLLAATQAKPYLGRLFTDADSQAGAVPTVILGFDTWRSKFASDPAIVGKQIRIDAQPVQIVGVMPKGFFAFLDFEIWMPRQITNMERPSNSGSVVLPFLILGEGQALNALSAEIESAVDDVNKSYPDVFNAKRHAKLIPAHLMYMHQVVPVLAAFVFITTACMLLGCMNVSMVFLARLMERNRELALRTALGASRSQLLRQCLLETSSIVFAGLLVGYSLAAAAFHWMISDFDAVSQTLAEGRYPLPSLQSSDLFSAIAIAVAVWLLSTLIPAWRVAKQDAAIALAGSGKGVAGSGAGRSAHILVGIQVIISCLVLVLCANTVIAVRVETNKPMGLNKEQLTITTLATVFDERYSEPSQRLQYWDDLSAAIANKLPDAEVAYAADPPSVPSSSPAVIEHQEGSTNRGILMLPVTSVSEKYFKMLGVKLLSGRLFDSTDNATSLRVVVVDEITAKRYWPDGDVLGRRLQLNPAENGPWLTIVGVVSSVTRPNKRDDGIVYKPLQQVVPKKFHVLVKVPNAAVDNRVALRAAAFAVDRDLPLNNLQTFDSYLGAINHSFTNLVPGFSFMAVITAVLAASGLFGLISRSVVQRTQEIGVRRALGATQWQVTAVFLRQGALYLCVGVIGIGLGIVVTKLLSKSIPTIFVHVAPVTTGVFVFMTLVILAASYLPTRKAVALEPGDALRYE
jgi:predicted permease